MNDAPGRRGGSALDIRIELATPDDAETILAIRLAAFAKVAEEYDDPDLPPLRETLDQVRDEASGYIVLKAIADGRIVGAVRAMDELGVVHIGRLTVDPAYQGRGIGTALAQAVLDHFSDARSFELFTGHKSHAPLAIYRKLGFREVRREPESEKVTLVYLERPGPLG